MIRPIHPGLAPNEQKKDFLLALSLLPQVWNYQNGLHIRKLELWFEQKYQQKAFSFSSGRGALYAILHGLDIQKGDEVLVTGFTCIAVVDAVLATGATPVYIDITENFVIDVDDLKKKITKKTKALILQHTFGISHALPEVLALSKTKKFFLIEDLAHGIGIENKKKLLGTFGIATLFSLGRDKAFSSVGGGIAITPDKKLAEKLQQFYEKQKDASHLWIFQNLFHVVSFYIFILPLYDTWIFGKLLLIFFQKVNLLAKPIDTKELEHFSVYTNKLPNAMACLALSQLERLHEFNRAREKNVAYYVRLLQQDYPSLLHLRGPLLRLPLLVTDAKQLKLFARKNGVYLGDWYSNLIDPKGTDIQRFFYDTAKCPVALHVAKHIVNLPTYPTLQEKEIEKVAKIVKQYA